MSLRSLLFVPADSERKLARAADAAADAIILDLEDAVAEKNKPVARAKARTFLQSSPAACAQIWVRINALNSPDAQLDLEGVMAGKPYGFVLPKVDHPSEIQSFGKMLTEFEVNAGITPGATRLMPLLETPRGILSAADYLQAGLRRLAGITWGAQDLSAALGIGSLRDANGEWDFALRSARAQCLLVARALDIDAIDTVTIEVKDPNVLRADCVRAKAAGFTGKLAIHPDQLNVIDDVFVPSVEELDRAGRIIATFAAAAGAGAVTLDGGMIDLVHLRAAQRLLSRAGARG